MTDGDIRRYTLWDRIHYQFNWNVDRVLIHTQCEWDHLRASEAPEGVHLAHLDPTSAADAKLWADLINAAYPDADAGVTTLPAYWAHHPLLSIRDVLVAFTGSQPVATVATGVYNAAPTVGGVARIGVLPLARGSGVGMWIGARAYQQTSEYGAQRLECVSMVNRVESLRLQFRLGFELQEDYTQVVPTIQKRRWPARRLALTRARRIREEFFADHPELRH